ncbi:MAG: hypothetical protein R3B12_01520 [Candidatus Saccharimonadales bacterium]
MRSDYEEIEQGIKRRVLDYLHNHREEISIQTVEYGEDYDVLLPLIEQDAPWSVEQILEKYSKRLAKTKSHTWWAKTLNIIRDKLPDPSATDALQMTAVHHLTLEEDNQVQGDFEIYDHRKRRNRRRYTKDCICYVTTYRSICRWLNF